MVIKHGVRVKSEMNHDSGPVPCKCGTPENNNNYSTALLLLLCFFMKPHKRERSLSTSKLANYRRADEQTLQDVAR